MTIAPDPTNPRLVTVMPLLGHGHFGIGLMWPYLYVTTWYEIEILDVTNPLAPIRVGVYTAPVFPYDFEIVDGLMYLADWTNGMMIVDLAQPAAPQQIASFPTTTWTDWLHVVGDRAYVVDYQGLTIVDVSNPFAPTTLGHVPSVGSSGYQRFDVKAGIACVPSYYAGIYLIDVSDPTAPASIGRYAEINHSEYITVSGSYAYTSGYTPGIRVVNLDAAGGPSQVREISGVRSTQLRVEGDRLCAASTEGITVYDIQSPDSPTALFSTPTEGTASDLVLEGPLIYTAERSAGLCIYDRSDPQQLVRIGQLPAPDPNSSAVGVAVSGDYAYVASYWEGLRVIDVSAPTEPQLVTVCPVGAQAMDVVVSGAHAYVSVRWDGVAVVDISDPLRPFVVARMPEFSDMLRIQSDLLYAGGSSQFSIYDISHPAAPLKLLTSSTPGYATSLEPQGNTLYVAAAHAGIAVYAVFRPGDLNCDGALDMFDIDPFVRAFAGEPAYGAAFPDCRWLSGDCNGDGNVTFADIDPFVSLLLRYHRPTR